VFNTVHKNSDINFMYKKYNYKHTTTIFSNATQAASNFLFYGPTGTVSWSQQPIIHPCLLPNLPSHNLQSCSFKMAQVISHWPLTAEGQACSQGSPHLICGKKKTLGQVFLHFLLFFCQYHSANATYSYFIHLTSTPFGGLYMPAITETPNPPNKTCGKLVSYFIQLSTWICSVLDITATCDSLLENKTPT
jgi:hypothetical protein